MATIGEYANAQGTAGAGNERTACQAISAVNYDIQSQLYLIDQIAARLRATTDLSQEQKDEIALMQAAAAKAQSRFACLVKYSEVKLQRGIDQESPFSLSSAVFQALRESIQGLPGQRAPELICEIQNPIRDYVVGNSSHLHEVLYGLLDRFVTIMKAGQIKLSISPMDEEYANPISEQNAVFKFAITYTPPVVDVMDYIDCPNSNYTLPLSRRFEDSRSRISSIDDLVFSLCQELVPLMGGRIWTEPSVHDLYFTCSFRVPDSGLAQLQQTLHGYIWYHKVLFIGQGLTDIRDRIVEYSNLLGLTCDTAKTTDGTDNGNLEIDLQTLAGVPRFYDCAIVESIAAARAVKEHTGLQHLPILMVTSKLSASIQSMTEAGIFAFLTWPCPVIELGNALHHVVAKAPSPTPSFDPPLNVLVAEDNDVNQKIANKYLKRLNHVPHLAGNGLEAVEQIQKTRFDVILMDLHMPVMGGLEAIEKIRDWERRNKIPITPIIAMYAMSFTHPEDRERLFCLQLIITYRSEAYRTIRPICSWTIGQDASVARRRTRDL
ncbi:hypothetical protein AJ80_09779 [Polytolypa hystricis UAMH7299]|uniref:Response regulatory domain-containing protein n=1 Tax=Polytolypa hystricis (strain UAMH7299) TaxID=1447883 RepID=A0A2B7WJW9_POLH7|nr:hypothetical protein AJ80_09779 [Polytolypa hystricis UAMH7299]